MAPRLPAPTDARERDCYDGRSMPSTLALIQALTQARLSGQTLCAADWVDAVCNEREAYAVQEGVAVALGWMPEGLARYWKSGGATRSGPFSHAPLDPAGIHAISKTWPLLGVEAEVALRLGREVSPAQALAMRAEEAGDWVDAMAVSVELVASRWREGLAAPELLRMADHQSHAALCLGEWQAHAPRDWPAQRCRLRIGAQAPLLRSGGHSLGDPTLVLPAWLRHLSRSGLSVPAGTVVTTGSWVGCLPVQTGEQVELVFDGLGQLTIVL